MHEPANETAGDAYPIATEIQANRAKSLLGTPNTLVSQQQMLTACLRHELNPLHQQPTGGDGADFVDCAEFMSRLATLVPWPRLHCRMAASSLSISATGRPRWVDCGSFS